MKPQLTLEAFADWCDTKGKERYWYMSVENCACAQYAEHLGLDYWKVAFRPGFWRDAELAACCAYSSTFSALASRIRKEKPVSTWSKITSFFRR